MFQDWVNLPYERTSCVVWERQEMDGYDTKKWKNIIVTSDINLGYIKHKDNVSKARCGYDPEIFKRLHKNYISEPIIVGWVGSRYAHENKKGYAQFYLPLGKHFRLFPHLKEEDFFSYEEMPSYYQKIDVLVVTSSWEGNPLPLIEATACNVPVVSARVGVAPEILPENQIVERSVEAFAKRIKEGNLVAPEIPFWSWEKTINQWENILK
jgi:hypothetical protein